VAVFGALIALNILWLLKLVGLARARMRSGGSSGGNCGGGDVSVGSGKAAGLALDAADAAQCKAMAAAAQPGGGASGAADAGGCLIKSCAGGGVGVGRVVSLSARAGSMSAVEAAAHAAAYAAARARLPTKEAPPQQGDASQGALRGAPKQGEDWMRSMEGEPGDGPAAAPAAGGVSSCSGTSGTSALVGKLQAMPSLGRQGMSGPLEAVSESGSGKWGGAHSGDVCSRSRQRSRCDCAFCGGA
jgi:hypothetical protein